MQMHSLWLLLSLTTFCYLLQSNEASPSNVILLWLGATRAILSPAKKEKPLALNTTPLPILKDIETDPKDVTNEDEMLRSLVVKIVRLAQLV